LNERNEHKVGGFHINDNHCGDDDLIPGTINLYKLYIIGRNSTYYINTTWISTPIKTSIPKDEEFFDGIMKK
jgi:hypothetical protein